MRCSLPSRRAQNVSRDDTLDIQPQRSVDGPSLRLTGESCDAALGRVSHPVAQRERVFYNIRKNPQLVEGRNLEHIGCGGKALSRPIDRLNPPEAGERLMRVFLRLAG